MYNPSQTQLISNRPQDTKVEQFITQWLDKYYFPKIFSNYSIISDRTMQLAGIDVIGDSIKYDIKAQASKKYLNNPTNTFSVEISFYDRNGYERVGWFISSRLETEAYIFIWIPKCSQESGYISDIEEVEAMIVDKEKLLADVAKIYNRNIKDKTSLEFAEEMRRLDMRNYWCENLKFVYSNQLSEQPINIILNKEYLLNFSTRHDLVTKDTITPIDMRRD